ncbi:MAG: restriction endonuclease subunit S, partial [Acutalibacteraceae bacterium]|nr:restriction endonuclease subunit S [Acutalibacteraceae bacterium]
MRSEWKECTIADLGEVVGGATPSTKKPENYENGDISWITPKDLSAFNSRFIHRGERNITEIGLNSCSTRLLPPNTVLFSSRAPIGYVAIAAKEMCTNQGFKSVIPNTDTDYMFLYYLLKYNRDNIENMGSGTTFKEVSGNTMKSIKVCVPVDIDEQRRIGAVLSAIDDKIELNTAINENLEQQAFLLLEQMLSIPHDDVCCLSDIANINPRYTLSKGTEARYIDMSQLSTTTSFPDGWTFRPYNGGMKFKNKDTIMARITPCLENGKTAYIDFLEEDET